MEERICWRAKSRV